MTLRGALLAGAIQQRDARAGRLEAKGKPAIELRKLARPRVVGDRRPGGRRGAVPRQPR